MKKLLSVFILMLLPMMASAYDIKIGDIYYNYINNGKELEVTSMPNGKYSGVVRIPEKVTYGGNTRSVTSIGEGAFFGCSGLTSVTIPNSVTSIGDRAFYGCNGLTSITIPNSVTNIGEQAFQGCSNLTSITIPNSVTSIEKYVFWECTGLTSITIPNSVTSIGDGAFQQCYGLTSITIPNSVTSIGKSAFAGCRGLTSITIPYSVMSIEESAFDGCRGLTSITIPNSVTSIGKSVFHGCTGLTSITIPYGVKYIGEDAFGGCTGLTSITIPNSMTSIGSYAFLHCHSLTSITIPDNVTSIGGCAFSECRDLTTIIIGSGIKNIYSYAFSNCPNINDVYCYAVRYPKTDKSAFDQSYPDYVTLHVPEESIEQYKNADPWSKFKAVVALKNGDPKTEDINVSGDSKCEKPSISYINGELVFSCTTNGCSFVSEIIDSDIKTHYDTRIALTATYYIKVYATKSGYENSDVATATLCWIDVDPKTEGISNGVANVSAMPVIIQNNGNVLNISGAPEGSVITVYDLSGKIVGFAKAVSERTNISISLRSGDVGIVKIGEKSVKIIIR